MAHVGGFAVGASHTWFDGLLQPALAGAGLCSTEGTPVVVLGTGAVSVVALALSIAVPIAMVVARVTESGYTSTVAVVVTSPAGHERDFWLAANQDVADDDGVAARARGSEAAYVASGVGGGHTSLSAYAGSCPADALFGRGGFRLHSTWGIAICDDIGARDYGLDLLGGLR